MKVKTGEHCGRKCFGIIFEDWKILIYWNNKMATEIDLRF